MCTSPLDVVPVETLCQSWYLQPLGLCPAIGFPARISSLTNRGFSAVPSLEKIHLFPKPGPKGALGCPWLPGSRPPSIALLHVFPSPFCKMIVCVSSFLPMPVSRWYEPHRRAGTLHSREDPAHSRSAHSRCAGSSHPKGLWVVHSSILWGKKKKPFLNDSRLTQ